MIWRSHRIVTGITVFLCTQSLVAAIAATTGSTFPDRAEMNLPMKHRGFSHWFPVYLFPAILLSALFPDYQLVYSLKDSMVLLLFADPIYAFPVFLRNLIVWFLIGALMHILEDTFTGYIPITSPKDKRSWYRPFYTGSPKENLCVILYTLSILTIMSLSHASEILSIHF